LGDGNALGANERRWEENNLQWGGKKKKTTNRPGTVLHRKTMSKKGKDQKKKDVWASKKINGGTKQTPRVNNGGDELNNQGCYFNAPPERTSGKRKKKND